MATRKKNSKVYWQDREAQEVHVFGEIKGIIKREKAVIAQEKKIYAAALDELDKELDALRKDVGDEAITRAAVQKPMTARDLEQWSKRQQERLDNLIDQYGDEEGRKIFGMENAKTGKQDRADRVVRRQEILKKSINAIANGAAAQTETVTQKALEAEAQNGATAFQNQLPPELKATAKVDFDTVDEGTVTRTAQTLFKPEDFSERIWANRDVLVKDLERSISLAVTNGWSIPRLAKEFEHNVAVDERSAERIARTEMNRVSNAAELAQYRQNNIKYYRFIATEDARTCEICGKLHDTVHATDEATPGENFPPVHPNCRCRTVISTVDENGNEDDSWLDDMQAEINALQDEFDEMDEDEERAQKESEIERDAEEQLQAVEDIDKKLKTIDEDIRRLDDFGEVLIVPMASITASEIEEVSIDIREQEIKVAELQQKAAALDDAVPKVDDKFIETLKYKQEEAKQRHDERIEKDTFGKENFMLALQNFPEYTEPTVSNDIEPKSHIGKLWQKVCHAVGKEKEQLFEEIKRFGKRIQDVQETFNTFKDWFEEIIGMFQPALAMAGGGSIRPNGLLMTTGSNAQPTNEQTEQPKPEHPEQPSDKKKAKRGTSDAAMAAKRVPAHGLAQNDVGKNIGLKKDGAKPVYQVAEEIIIPDNKRSHIFTQKHFGEIPFEDAERKILEIIRNKDNYIGTSGYWRQANDWYVEIDKNGGQWWVKINENGQIEDAGYNPPNKPRTWKNHGGLAQN